MLRGIDLSLAGAGMPDALIDPVLKLRDTNGTLPVENSHAPEYTLSGIKGKAALT